MSDEQRSNLSEPFIGVEISEDGTITMSESSKNEVYKKDGTVKNSMANKFANTSIMLGSSRQIAKEAANAWTDIGLDLIELSEPSISQSDAFRAMNDYLDKIGSTVDWLYFGG